MEPTPSQPETRSLKRNSDDVGWEYGELFDKKNPDKVKCKLCSKQMSGGVYRIKEHIAHIPGNVKGCSQSTKDDQVKCRNAIIEAKKKKVSKKHEYDMLRAEVNIDMQKHQDELEENFGTLKPCNFQGPMDKFATAIRPEATLGMQQRQQTINAKLFKEKTYQVQQYCARCIYQSGIPFNAIDNDAFKMFCEALGQFGPGWVPPTQYQLSEPLLKEEEERLRKMLKSEEEEWERYGCSIMTDGWTDMKRRSIMNLCVNSRGGTCFRSSKDTSSESHTGLYIFEYVDKCISEVGADKVVQVVTDNALNNMAAAKMLKEKRPNIFWTGCAAHTVDLMLEGICKLPKFAKIIDQAKDLTVFIYAHHKTLSMMRENTKKRDIVRPGVTRFATTFLTLQSLLDKKTQLKTMFLSAEWDQCKYSKFAKGKFSYSTVVSPAFWIGVEFVLKVFEPLVKLLRIADGEKKPSMGFIFGELLEAKSKIKLACNDLERNYKPIFDIIDEKMKGRLDSPLHLSAYLLNPFYFYKDTTMEHDQMLIDGFMNCVETFYHDDYDKQDKVINHEFNDYKTKAGAFGRAIASRGCQKNDEKYDPGNWWSLYGCNVPALQKLATRILALTSSSSGYERNWSAFAGIHTRKRNRLVVDRLTSLVYVQFNAKFFNRRRRIKDKNVDVILDDGDERNAEEWFMDLGEEEHEPTPNEDIDSDEENDMAVDFEFESDNEQEVNVPVNVDELA